MLKRPITYEDFNGNTQTEVFYFNLTKTEIVELEVEIEGGLQATLQRIIKEKDEKNLLKEFKRLVLLSFGEKSEDGKRFVKNDQLREEFSQTAAFQALYLELMTDAGAAAAFVNGVIPKDVAQQIKDHDKPTGPPGSLAPQGPPPAAVSVSPSEVKPPPILETPRPPTPPTP